MCSYRVSFFIGFVPIMLLLIITITIRYLWSLTNWYGNFPVWSVKIFSLVSKNFKTTSLFHFLGSIGRSFLIFYLPSSSFFSWVYLTHCLCCFMQPFWALLDSGKWALLLSMVSPDHPTSRLLQIAFNIVAFRGNPNDAYKYPTNLIVLINS